MSEMSKQLGLVVDNALKEAPLDTEYVAKQVIQYLWFYAGNYIGIDGRTFLSVMLELNEGILKCQK